MSNETSWTEKIGDKVSLRHLLIGLGAVVFVYLAIWGFVFIESDKTITQLEDRLASKTTMVTDSENIDVKEEPHTPAEPAKTAHHDTTHDNEKKAHAPAVQHHEEHVTEHVVEHKTKTPAHDTPHHAPAHDTHRDQHAAKPTTPVTPQSAGKTEFPIEGFYDQTEYGPLPKVRVIDRATPFDAYKKPVIPMGQPKIGLIVHDFGLSDSASAAALERLPIQVTMLVSPYAKAPDEWRKKAQNAGHETWLYMPFETANSAFNDPGPQALLTTTSLKYNESNLKKNMGMAAGYPGVAASTDETFANSKMMLNPLMDKIYNRGLAFLELNPNAPDTIKGMNTKSLAPYIKADIVINGTTSTIKGSPLKELERIAQEQGHAIGVLYPHPNSLKQISLWLNSLEGKGFALMPVSSLAKADIPLAPVTPNE